MSIKQLEHLKRQKTKLQHTLRINRALFSLGVNANTVMIIIMFTVMVLVRIGLKEIGHPNDVIYLPSGCNLYAFLSSAEHKRRYFEECVQPNRFCSSLTSMVFFSIKSVGTS